MACGAGPYLPRPGWGSRWVRQAADLCLRSPAALAITGAAFFAIGIVATETVNLYGLGVLLSLVLALSGCAGAASMMAVHAILMREDGYSGLDIGDLGPRISGVMPIILGVNLVIASSISLLVWAILSPNISPVMLGGPEDPSDVLTIFGAVHGMGALGISNGMIASIIIMPLWLATATCMGMGADEASAVDYSMTGDVRRILRTIFLVLLVWCAVVGIVPWYVAIPGTLFVNAWTYVAAREIFGGISENGETAGEPAPST